jgi:hypothetical protein
MNESLLDKNCRIIQERWPGLWEQLASTGSPEWVELTCTPEPTLVIDGIHLSSGFQRLREAELQARLAPEDSPKVWVYGFGLGDLPRVLLKRKKLERLTNVILSRAIAFQSLSHFDHTDWLADKRVDLKIAQPTEVIEFPFTAVPACLRLVDNSAARLRDQVSLELATPFIRSQYREDASLHRRMEENLPMLLQDGDVAALFGSLPGKKIMVAAAGPTLSDHFTWLAGREKGNTLIAVDAAIKPLVTSGVIPDLAVVIDEKETVQRFFQFDLTSLLRTTLIYFPGVHPFVLKEWPGPRLAAYPEKSDRYNRLANCYSKGRLFSSGSVIHPAVDLAVKMGAAEVLLLGADFSYPRGISHVVGAATTRVIGKREALGLWVLNGYGDRIPTRADLRWFLCDLERYIFAHPEVHFINSSREGARITGCLFGDHRI